MNGLTFDADTWDVFGTAQAVGADNSFDTPRTAQTVTGDAIGSMTPITSPGDGQWSGFWQDMIRGVTGYAIQRDAARNAITPTGSPAPVPAAASGATGGASRAGMFASPLIVIALGGAIIFAAVKLAK